MIPHPHRQKGGAPLLGAHHPGEIGPFGEYGADEDDGQDDEQPSHRERHDLPDSGGPS